jgi:membrane-associated PAP2 superfamily phosphatase
MIKISLNNPFYGPIVASILIIIFSFLILIFNLDLNFSKFFWHPEDGFSFKDSLIEFLIYNSINWAVIISLILSLIFLMYSSITKLYTQYKSIVSTYLIALIVGPGIIVNAILKSNWGRPRPVQINNFNGEHQFLEFFQYNFGGFGNSFTSGHASVPLIFTVFGFFFITKNNKAIGTKILYFCILWFLLTGLARIMAGGHFLSDVVWSGYISYLIAWISYRYYYLTRITRTNKN